MSCLFEYLYVCPGWHGNKGDSIVVYMYVYLHTTKVPHLWVELQILLPTSTCIQCWLSLLLLHLQGAYMFWACFQISWQASMHYCIKCIFIFWKKSVLTSSVENVAMFACGKSRWFVSYWFTEAIYQQLSSKENVEREIIKCSTTNTTIRKISSANTQCGITVKIHRAISEHGIYGLKEHSDAIREKNIALATQAYWKSMVEK